jgi:hypothetical protein
MLALLEGFVMEILVRAKCVYGKNTYYPLCEKAKLFAAIAGTKTLTPEVLGGIKELGYKLVFEVTDWEAAL